MAHEQPALAPYRRIAAAIQARIESGDIPLGENIPSVRQIVATEGVSTATATRVAAVLRDAGYAETVPGVGTVARIPTKLTTGPDRLTMLRATGDGMRPNERVEVISSELVAAPVDVADALGVEEGGQAVARRRVYRDDLGVVAVSTSWLPAKFAESAHELLSVEPLPLMTFGLIEQRTGRRASRRRDVVAIRPVPSDVAELLGVEPGREVLTMTNTYWDQRGEPTEHALDYLGAGRELSAEHAL